MGRMKIKHVLRRNGNLARSDCRRPLLENNNSSIQADYDQGGAGRENPLHQNNINIHREHGLRLHQPEELTIQNLAELLTVPPDAVTNAAKERPDGSVRLEAISGPQNLDPGVFHLLQRSVSVHFPKPPAELDQNLQQHLDNVQNSVLRELMRLGCALERMGLMGPLINCYHCHLCNHLDSLLRRSSSFSHCFVLTKWALKTYLSQEMLGHTELEESDPLKNVDLLLFAEFGVKAKNRLLEHTQREVRGHLENILLNDGEDSGCSTEEAYVRTYVDTIRCIAAMSTEAEHISADLADKIKEVCFQELQIFVARYRDEQTEVLKKTVKTEEPQMILFFKTLKTCQELMKHVKTEGKGIRASLVVDIEKTLEKTEASTLELLKAVVMKVAKKHLGHYFSSENKQFFFLLNAVKTMLPQLENPDDVQKQVTDEVYRIIVQTYIEHLLKMKLRKLEKSWSLNVAQIVSQDAELLHDTMTQLDSDVMQRNCKLLKIREVLELNDHDALKVTVAAMQKESLRPSEDLELLYKLLQWKGLSKWEIREVLDAIPDDYLPTSRAGCFCLAGC